MRLIDADALIEFIDVGHLRPPAEICFSELDVKNLVDKQPTIERKTGKWIKKWNSDLLYCSECDLPSMHNWPYCERCGADMRTAKCGTKIDLCIMDEVDGRI